MSSKKKKRHQEWLKREAKRLAKKEAAEKYDEAMRSGDMEKMATVMGIKLK